MKRKMTVLVLLTLLLLPALAMGHDARLHKVRLVNFRRPLPAPAFTLEDPRGQPVPLSDFRGKYVLLNFFATWCPPCVAEMPSMERLARTPGDRAFVVLAVSLDEEGAYKVIPFIERLKVTFPIALDPQARVSGIYGAWDLPSTFLINPRGEVVAAAKGERDWSSPGMVSYISEIIGS